MQAAWPSGRLPFKMFRFDITTTKVVTSNRAHFSNQRSKGPIKYKPISGRNLATWWSIFDHHPTQQAPSPLAGHADLDSFLTEFSRWP